MSERATRVSCVTTLTARFSIAGADEMSVQPAGSDDPSWVSGLAMRKQYTAGIVGTGVLVFLHSGADDSRAYIAVERVTGQTPDGRTGSFTVHHGALNTPHGDEAFGYVISGTGDGDFTHFAGAAKIEHDDEGAYFVFELA
jgi:hypothetical protein